MIDTLIAMYRYYDDRVMDVQDESRKYKGPIERVL